MQMIQADKKTAQAEMAVLLDSSIVIEPADVLNETFVLFDSSLIAKHPFLYYYEQQQKIAGAQTQLEKAKLQPEWLLGYTNQSIIGYQMNKDRTETYYDGGKRFSTVQLGLGIPIFSKAQRARIKAAQQNEIVSQASTELARQQLELNLQRQWNEYVKYQQVILYYKTSALSQAQVIIKTANLNYKNGEINYIEWGTLISNAINVQTQYLDALQSLNIARTELEYLLQPNE